jgi:prepilin-type N-terminal cleavage/methylation domain-containing protein
MLQRLLKQRDREKGFTLIEIVLVLAIASLIMVIVFLAVAGAQRARRDSQRQSDAGRALAGVESCASNNNGQYANCLSSAQIITANYFSGTGPGGTAYSVVAGAPSADGQLQVQSPGACPTAGGTVSVKVWQEAGAVYCVHN